MWLYSGSHPGTLLNEIVFLLKGSLKFLVFILFPALAAASSMLSQATAISLQWTSLSTFTVTTIKKSD